MQVAHLCQPSNDGTAGSKRVTMVVKQLAHHAKLPTVQRHGWMVAGRLGNAVALFGPAGDPALGRNQASCVGSTADQDWATSAQETQTAFRVILNHVARLLRAAGFKRRSPTRHRHGRGIVTVVNLQATMAQPRAPS